MFLNAGLNLIMKKTAEMNEGIKTKRLYIQIEKSTIYIGLITQMIRTTRNSKPETIDNILLQSFASCCE